MKEQTIVDNIVRSAIAQGTGAVVDSAFATLMIAAGLPEAVALTPIVRGATIGLVNQCYDDFKHRLLSSLESRKLDVFSTFALQTFFELAEKDGVTPMQQQIEEGQLQYAYEVADDAMLTAIRQSEQTKIEVLGRYYGSQLYKDKIEWQDMHMMLAMVETLSLRQLVMIRLIADDFKGMDTKLFISNPSACVEMNRLLDFGIWQTEGASFGTNNSWTIQLDSIIPTSFSEYVKEVLMLERISEKEVNRTVAGLRLTAEGTSQQTLTEDEYRKHTEWQEFDDKGNFVFDANEHKKTDEDEAQFLYDSWRGK